jgi:hypothetical protein
MEFRNEFKSSRSGFSHTSSLYNNGSLLAVEKRNYINRTWESYPYQSSMRGAVGNAINNEIARVKVEKGIKRLTQTLKQDIIDNSELIKELTKLKSTL